MKSFDVIVVGTVCCDLIFYGLPSIPELGEEVWTDGLEVSAGGAINTPAALSRLGVKTGLPTPVGNDMWSDIIVAKMQAENISTDLVYSVNRPFPQVSVALNYHNDRSFVSYGEKVDNTYYHEHLLHTIKNNDAGIIHFYSSRDEGFLNVMKAAKKQGKLISLDTGWDPEWLKSDELKKQIELADIFLPNEKEAKKITGKDDAREALHDLTELTNTVVIKLGAAGAIASADGTIFESASEKVNAVDTTGAGDCFVAGFLYGILKKKPVKDCLWIGNYVGGCCVSSVGGYQGAPNINELQMNLQNYYSVSKKA